MDPIPDKPKSPKIFDQNINNESGKSESAGTPNMWELFGLARPKELSRNLRSQDTGKETRLKEKIIAGDTAKEKKSSLTNLFDGRKMIRKKEYVKAFIKAKPEDLARNYGISKKEVRTWKDRAKLAYQVAGHDKGSMPSYLKARDFRSNAFKLKHSPKNAEVAEKLYAENRKNIWEAVKEQRKLTDDMLGK